MEAVGNARTTHTILTPKKERLAGPSAGLVDLIIQTQIYLIKQINTFFLCFQCVLNVSCEWDYVIFCVCCAPCAMKTFSQLARILNFLVNLSVLGIVQTQDNVSWLTNVIDLCTICLGEVCMSLSSGKKRFH